MSKGKMTNFDCYYRGIDLIKSCQLGHSCRHLNQSLKDLKIRQRCENLNTVSTITVPLTEVLDLLAELFENSAEEIEAWVNNPSANCEASFLLKCDSSVGIVLSKGKWCNQQHGETSSTLQLVLQKYHDRGLGHCNFKIVTLYCYLSEEEKENARLRNTHLA